MCISFQMSIFISMYEMSTSASYHIEEFYWKYADLDDVDSFVSTYKTEIAKWLNEQSVKVLNVKRVKDTIYLHFIFFLDKENIKPQIKNKRFWKL